MKKKTAVARRGTLVERQKVTRGDERERRLRFDDLLHAAATAGKSNTAEFPHRTITGYRAGPGWDPVTGWGSPNAQVLVPLLAHYASR